VVAQGADGLAAASTLMSRKAQTAFSHCTPKALTSAQLRMSKQQNQA
jgi:hypothetical protein